MVRNIVVLGGSSHPSLTESICDQLGLPPGNGEPIELPIATGSANVAIVLLSKFSVGETRVEIKESVRVRSLMISCSRSTANLQKSLGQRCVYSELTTV